MRWVVFASASLPAKRVCEAESSAVWLNDSG